MEGKITVTEEELRGLLKGHLESTVFLSDEIHIESIEVKPYGSHDLEVLFSNLPLETLPEAAPEQEETESCP